MVQARRGHHGHERAGARQAAAEPAADASQRERAKAGTRAALIEAAMALFATHGLAAPSLDAICARAGYTRGAFYVHFRDREDLVAAVMERALGAFLDAIIASGEQAHDLERTVRRFEDAVGVIAQLRAAGPRGRQAAATGVPFHRILEACERSPEIRERFVALLGEAAERVAKTAAAGQSAAAVRGDVPAESLGVLLVTLALGFVAAIEVGAPFDPGAARGAVLALLAPQRRRDAPGSRG